MSDEMMAMDDQNAGGNPMMGNDGANSTDAPAGDEGTGSTEEAAM